MSISTLIINTKKNKRNIAGNICLHVVILLVFTNLFEIKAQNKFFGDSTFIGSGKVTTWVEVDSENNPLRIGLTMSETALSNLPNISTNVSLNLPEVAGDSLFKHIYFNWNPQGHQPNGIYNIPHFDIHFYIITQTERLQIPGGFDFTPVAPEFMPEDYIFVPGEENFSVPQMGVHYVDSLASELHGNTFTTTLIYGFYGGIMLFVEPMITRDYLLTLPDDILPIKQPASYQKSGYYPITYVIYYDSAEASIDIIIKDFKYRSAVSSLENSDYLFESFELSQNYPNPFNPTTTISWQSSVGSHQTIKIYDLLGKEVSILVDEYRPAGSYKVEFDGSDLPSGVYIYKLSGSGFNSAKKLVLIR